MAVPKRVEVELTEEVHERLTQLAARLEQSPSWVVERAVEAFVAEQDSVLARIRQGLADADAGRFVSHDAIKTWLESWGKPDEKHRPNVDPVDGCGSRRLERNQGFHPAR